MDPSKKRRRGRKTLLSEASCSIIDSLFKGKGGFVGEHTRPKDPRSIDCMHMVLVDICRKTLDINSLHIASQAISRLNQEGGKLPADSTQFGTTFPTLSPLPNIPKVELKAYIHFFLKELDTGPRLADCEREKIEASTMFFFETFPSTRVQIPTSAVKCGHREPVEEKRGWYFHKGLELLAQEAKELSSWNKSASLESTKLQLSESRRKSIAIARYEKDEPRRRMLASAKRNKELKERAASIAKQIRLRKESVHRDAQQLDAQSLSLRARVEAREFDSKARQRISPSEQIVMEKRKKKKMGEMKETMEQMWQEKKRQAITLDI